MTTAAATAESKSIGTKEKNKDASAAIKKKSTTGPTLKRLLEYMNPDVVCRKSTRSCVRILSGDNYIEKDGKIWLFDNQSAG
jgi:hypothetical protein